MGNQKTKNLKQGATSSTYVHPEERQSSNFIEENCTNIKKLGKDGSSIFVVLGNHESIEQLKSFMRNHKQVTDIRMFLSTCSHSGKDSLLSLVNTFSNSDCMENLRVLTISGERIGDEGIRILAESRNLKNIVKFEVCNQSICDEGVKHLTKFDILNNITELDLSYNDIGDEGIEALSSCKNLKNLTHLNLSRNKISNIGLQHLSKSHTIGRLSRLDLDGNHQVSDEGIKAISSSKVFANLSYITISNTEVGFDGIEAIITSQYLTKLLRIILGYNAFDLKGSDSIDIRCIALLAKHLDQHRMPFTGFRDYIIEPSLQGSRSSEVRQIIYGWLLEWHSLHWHSSGDNIFGEVAATEMLLDIARDDSSGDSVHYIINNYNKLRYRFLINFKDDKGNSLSSLYNRSINMQRFLFKNGMVPQSFHGEDILFKENISSLTESLSELIMSYVEKNVELQGALRDLISGSLDVTKPEGITFNQQILLSKINRELCSKITGHASHPNYSIYNYDFPLGYDKPMISIKEYRLIIEELRKVENLQEYVSPTSSMVDISSKPASNTSRNYN